ncbi:MAG: hypothetical protein IPP74_06080 [Alphaproteobacteria bacterium]|nr:hypothetical protein [Alphaproteobacteria bacterium]
MTTEEIVIDYEALIDEAMYMIVRRALEIIAKGGLPGAHHFYITFQTQFSGVEIPDYLRKKYPEEMTIVLQYQFHSLKIEQDKFSVSLSFNNVPERLVIPFGSIISFADPSVQFGLQFRRMPLEDDEDWEPEHTAEVKEFAVPSKKATGKKGEEKGKKETKKSKSGDEVSDASPKKPGKKSSSKKASNNVISLDSFRKK